MRKKWGLVLLVALLSNATWAASGMSAPKADQLDNNALFDAITSPPPAPDIATWARLAERGDADAQFKLGVALFYGRDIKADVPQAHGWFYKAAMQGHADAQAFYAWALLFELAERGSDGATVTVMEYNSLGESMLFWARKAAEQKSPVGCILLALLYRDGLGVPQDYSKAHYWLEQTSSPEGWEQSGEWARDGKAGPVDNAAALKWFRKAAERGYAKSQLALAQMLLDGRGTDQDIAQALQWAEKAAAQDDIAAITWLATLYHTGGAVPQDPEASNAWWQRAVALGDRHAMTSLGVQLQNAATTAEQKKKVTALYQQAAALGDTWAQYDLGLNLLDGFAGSPDQAAAMQWLQLAWSNGNARAAWQIGNMYAQGEGVSQSDSGAVEWWLKSALGGEIRGKRALAWAYLYGEHTANFPQALYWLENMAGQNNGWALATLGDVYLDNKFVPRDVARALDYYTRSVAIGDVHGQAGLGHMYLNGLGTPANPAEGMRLLRIAAKGNDPRAYTDLYNFYQSDWRVFLDPARALKHLTESVRYGVTRSMVALAMDYQYGIDTAPDPVQAQHWYEEAAWMQNEVAQAVVVQRALESMDKNPAQARLTLTHLAKDGLAVAQDALGSMYENGQGGPVDAAQALDLYRKAAAQKLAMAQMHLAHLYAEGLGVTQDYTEAFHWYQLSADQGNALARLGLSGLYYAGKGTRVDAAQGFALARQAAAQGNATAMYIVADAYRNGLGVSKDAAAALVAMNKAAEAGSLDAQMDLAEILEKGEGTNINIEGAISWYKKAAAQHDDEASAALVRLGVSGT